MKRYEPYTYSITLSRHRMESSKLTGVFSRFCLEELAREQIRYICQLDCRKKSWGVVKHPCVNGCGELVHSDSPLWVLIFAATGTKNVVSGCHG